MCTQAGGGGAEREGGRSSVLRVGLDPMDPEIMTLC